MNRDKIDLKIKKLAHYQGLELPSYQTEQAAGMDLLAAVDESGVEIKSGCLRIDSCRDIYRTT